MLFTGGRGRSFLCINNFQFFFFIFLFVIICILFQKDMTKMWMFRNKLYLCSKFFLPSSLMEWKGMGMSLVAICSSHDIVNVQKTFYLNFILLFMQFELFHNSGLSCIKHKDYDWKTLSHSKLLAGNIK